MALVTAIIYTNNAGEYIKNIISSIKNQTFFKESEFIFVEECSQHNSFALIKVEFKQDQNVKCINLKEDTGRMSCFINGFNESVGKYVIFLEPDDLLHHKALEIMYNTMVENDLDVLECGAIKLNDKNTHIIKILSPNFNALNNQDILDKFYRNKLNNYTRNKMYKREVVQKANELVNDMKVSFLKSNTIPYNIFMLSNCKKYDSIQTPLYSYKKVLKTAYDLKNNKMHSSHIIISLKKIYDIFETKLESFETFKNYFYNYVLKYHIKDLMRNNHSDNDINIIEMVVDHFKNNSLLPSVIKELHQETLVQKSTPDALTTVIKNWKAKRLLYKQHGIRISDYK